MSKKSTSYCSTDRIVPSVAASTRGRICRAFVSLLSRASSLSQSVTPMGFAGFAVCENDVADVARLTGNARMHDVPNHVGDSGDAVGGRFQEVHARDHSHLQVVAMVSRDRDRREVSGVGFRAMELAGLEPATSWVRSRRSPN